MKLCLIKLGVKLNGGVILVKSEHMGQITIKIWIQQCQWCIALQQGLYMVYESSQVMKTF